MYFTLLDHHLNKLVRPCVPYAIYITCNKIQPQSFLESGEDLKFFLLHLYTKMFTTMYFNHTLYISAISLNTFWENDFSTFSPYKSMGT